MAYKQNTNVQQVQQVREIYMLRPYAANQLTYSANLSTIIGCCILLLRCETVRKAHDVIVKFVEEQTLAFTGLA